MTKDTSKLPQDKCPFWSGDNIEECGISKGGMFIPMPEHITMFCTSVNFPKCKQYIRGCGPATEHEKKHNNNSLNESDRRRMRRFPEQIYLDFIINDTNSTGTSGRNYKAKTIDVSLGGLRIESYNELRADSIISFILNPEFSEKELLGIGEVKWCKPKKSTNKYESGISFANFSTSEGIRQYLGL